MLRQLSGYGETAIDMQDMLHCCQLCVEIKGWRCGCIKGPRQNIFVPIITKEYIDNLKWSPTLLNQIFIMSCLITRHSSIWITRDSIHCSLPSQLPKLAKSGDMTLSFLILAKYSVMRDIHDARRVYTNGKKMSLLFTYSPHTNIQMNSL